MWMIQANGYCILQPKTLRTKIFVDFKTFEAPTKIIIILEIFRQYNIIVCAVEMENANHQPTMYIQQTKQRTIYTIQ